MPSIERRCDRRPSNQFPRRGIEDDSRPVPQEWVSREGTEDRQHGSPGWVPIPQLEKDGANWDGLPDPVKLSQAIEGGLP